MARPESGVGLIEELSNVDRQRVAVDPQAIRYGKGCFVCFADEGEQPVMVRFTRTLILGVLGGIESFWLEVPLCNDCSARYRSVMSRIALVQVACFLLAAGAFGLLFLSFENEALKPHGTTLAVLGIAAVVVAFTSIGLRARALPVKFSPRQHGQLGRYGAYVFTFANSAAAARFADANR